MPPGRVRLSALAIIAATSVVAVSAQSKTGARVFRVPYSGAAASEVSNVLLTVPFTRIGKPWSAFSRRTGGSREEIALRELLDAVYRGDNSSASARITPPAASASGKAFDDYVAAFRTSLQSAGDLQIEGYFPLPGRVRFALRPVAGGPYRLFTFRQSGDRLRFNETQAPNTTDSLLNAVLRVAATQPLEASAAAGGVTVVLEPNRPAGDVRLTVPARWIDADAGLLETADAALQFYQKCVSLPAKNAVNDYFGCFVADVQPRLRQEFAKMTPAEQQRVAGTMTASRHIDFVVENPTSEVVFYHSTVSGVQGRDWIEKLPNGSFAMLSPMMSFPLADVLSKRKVREAILATLATHR